MKRLALPTTILVLLSAVTAWSGEERNPGGQDKPGAKAAPAIGLNTWATAWDAGKSAADWYIESTGKVVNLTDAQKQAVKDIFAARDRAMSAFQTNNAEKLKAATLAIEEAAKNQDQPARIKAQQAYQELYSPVYAAMKEANDKLEQVLTPQQKAKQKEHQITLMVQGMTAGVQLSDEQFKAMKAVVAAREKAMQDFQTKNSEKLKAASRAIMGTYASKDKDAVANAWKANEGLYAPMHKAMKEANDAVQKILTPEQKAKQKEYQFTSLLNAMAPGVQFSDEQVKKVRAAWDEGQKGGHEAAGSNWYKTFQDVLTPEQKEALKKARAAWGQRRGAGGFWAPGAPAGGKPEAGTGKCPATEKKPEATLWRATRGQGIAQSGEARPNEKPAQDRIYVFSEGKPETRDFWLGLGVEPHGRGLLIQHVVPDSPAAKVGLKPQDVVVRASGRPVKSIAELVEAVQLVKGRNVFLEVLRDGKMQNFSLKPARRMARAETVGRLDNWIRQTEPRKPAQPNVKVTRLPGGGIQVVIGEAAEGEKRGETGRDEFQEARKVLEKLLEGARAQKAATEARQASPTSIDSFFYIRRAQIALAEAQQALQRAQAFSRPSAASSMHEKVKRQHELANEAWTIYQKMDSLGDGKKGEAHELREKLERVEGELRRTFEPAPATLQRGLPYRASVWTPRIGEATNPRGGLVPGAALNPTRGVPTTPQNPWGGPRPAASLPTTMNTLVSQGFAQMPGAPRLNPAPIGVPAGGVLAPGTAVARFPQGQAGFAAQGAAFGTLAPGASPAVVREGREFQELRNQVQELRRQVEELKAMVKRSRQPETK